MGLRRLAVYVNILVVIWGNLRCVKSSDRIKRELKFPRGASIALSAALATHYPNGPLSDGLNQVLEFDFGFPFPEEVAYNGNLKKVELRRKVWKEPSKWTGNKFNWERNNIWMGKRREKRNIKERQKESLAKRLENVVSRLGYNGFACISRFQCDLYRLSPENSLIEELLIGVLKLSSGIRFQGKNCDDFVPDCPLSILHVFLHSQQNVSLSR